MTLFRIVMAMLLPSALCAVTYQAEKNERYASCSPWTKQVLIGISFGVLAILATEFGIPMGDAILNVRNAAPLAAGLVFGWPAGLIAGFIGGIERWFAVLWGASEYTRLAGALGTILAGITGAAVRRFMMDNRKASWFYGLAVGIAVEVCHMLLVFLTHMDELQRAFEVVRACAVPMILANSLSVMCAIAVVTQLSRKKEPVGHAVRKIAQTFQRWLLVCVVLAFCATGVFTYFFQNQLAMATASYTLKLNLQDVRQAIQDASDKHLLELTSQIAAELDSENPEAELVRLTQQYDVSEINLVDAQGIITASTNPDFVGYDMADGQQSAAFLPLLTGTAEMVQAYQPVAYDASISRKYAGVAFEQGGFLQVGYDAQRFQRDISEQVITAAKNRHIGRSGCIIICDESGIIVSDRDGHEGERIDLLGYAGRGDFQEDVCFTDTIYGAPSYCMFTQTDGYYILAVLAVSEAMFSRDVAVFILAFMETLVFAGLFAQIYFLVKKLVVENIQKINQSLSRITGGDLNVTVDVRANEEFASLSDDINTTVDTLKHYIDEAAARIDKELEFARKIQHAALPSVFPPYPQRKDFHIFASMDTAKEVGGDFYDFYMLGDDKLAFLIADVSGKGIPAAMFMMTAKTLIKGFAESGLEVHEVFTRANAKLCEGNDANMFVTAWMGILDLKTGLLSYANAGHNPPVLRSRDGDYAFVKSRPNLILAGMEGVRYRKNELQLHPGDEIYLYTDGVTEAQNVRNELFGDQRLLASLNEVKGMPVEEICRKVKADVDAFAGEADQFDDITMVSIRLNFFGEDNAQASYPSAST
ncbi:MAG: SpoIIE family protein phosphatase [Aristaeellaceae bacterium]